MMVDIRNCILGDFASDIEKYMDIPDYSVEISIADMDNTVSKCKYIYFDEESSDCLNIEVSPFQKTDYKEYTVYEFYKYLEKLCEDDAWKWVTIGYIDNKGEYIDNYRFEYVVNKDVSKFIIEGEYSL